MKKISLLVIICLFILSANGVFALKYSDGLLENPSYSDISQQHISEAQLLLSYIVRYKEDINTLYKRHTRGTTPTMRDTNIILDDMILALETIQSKQVNPDTVESLMLEIVRDIKIVNTRMKAYLQERKKIHDDKLASTKQKYVKTAKKISNTLDSLIYQLTNILSQQTNLSEDEISIVQSLVRLRDENNKIKRFEVMSFQSEAEMQLYFKNIITELRKEILIIQEASR